MVVTNTHCREWHQQVPTSYPVCDHTAFLDLSVVSMYNYYTVYIGNIILWMCLGGIEEEEIVQWRWWGGKEGDGLSSSFSSVNLTYNHFS